jgi:hypothetical protein
MFKNLYVILLFVTLLFNGEINESRILASSNAIATIKPGPLTLVTTSERIKFSLNKERTFATSSAGTLVVTDATGSGAGWHVTVEGSPVFEEKSDGTLSNLPKGSFRLYKGGTEMTSNGGVFPHFFDSNYLVLDDGKQNTVLTAYADEGMGQCHIMFADDSMRLYLPRYNENSTYFTSITWSITQGP